MGVHFRRVGLVNIRSARIHYTETIQCNSQQWYSLSNSNELLTDIYCSGTVLFNYCIPSCLLIGFPRKINTAQRQQELHATFCMHVLRSCCVWRAYLNGSEIVLHRDRLSNILLGMRPLEMHSYWTALHACALPVYTGTIICFSRNCGMNEITAKPVRIALY